MTNPETLYRNLVDIHCHLLPNIDDGPTSWEESVEMARMASQNGIRVAVTTPHWIQGTSWQPSPSEVKSKVNELNERLRKDDIPLTVLPGMEVGITENLDKLASSGRILTLGESGHLLLEIPFLSLPYGIEALIFNLKTMGIQPVLGHPERNQDIQKNPKRILEFVHIGAIVQVTAGSYSGQFGESARQCAIELARLGAIHAVASDAHSLKKRPPVLADGLRILEEHIGREKVESIVADAHGFIQAGTGLKPAPA